METCLESLKKQTEKSFEIIIVDNSSADKSIDIAEKMFEDYPEKILKIIKLVI